MPFASVVLATRARVKQIYWVTWGYADFLRESWLWWKGWTILKMGAGFIFFQRTSTPWFDTSEGTILLLDLEKDNSVSVNLIWQLE